MLNNILILYFSGSGATKVIAQAIKFILEKNEKLSESCNIDIFAVEKANTLNLNLYDAFVIGTPVYHGEPCRMLMNYFSTMSPTKDMKPTFIFNTRAMCSCNTNRILAKKISPKNLVVIMDKDYRSPASDGALIAPFVRRFFKFDKDIKQNLYKDCNDFVKELSGQSWKHYVPKFRFSSILNAPNKLAGQMKTFRIYLHKELCIKCKVCLDNCPHQTIVLDEQDFPKVMADGCENCYRCIHHCPNLALSLSKKHPTKKVITYLELT